MCFKTPIKNRFEPLYSLSIWRNHWRGWDYTHIHAVNSLLLAGWLNNTTGRTLKRSQGLKLNSGTVNLLRNPEGSLFTAVSVGRLYIACKCKKNFSVGPFEAPVHLGAFGKPVPLAPYCDALKLTSQTKTWLMTACFHSKRAWMDGENGALRKTWQKSVNVVTWTEFEDVYNPIRKKVTSSRGL